MPLTSKSLFLKLYLLLGVFESALAFYFVATISSDLKNAVFLGYSPSRLALLAVAGSVLVLFGLLFMGVNVSRAFSDRVTAFVDGANSDGPQRFWVLFSSLALLIFGAVLFLMPVERLGGLVAQAQRLAPIIHLGSAIGFQSLIFLFAWGGGRLYWRNLLHWKHNFIIAGAVLAVLAVLSAWIARTGIGLLPEKYGWHFPGTPILFSQLFFAWLVALPFVLWEKSIEKWSIEFQQGRRFTVSLDLIICLMLGLAAFLLWWTEPMMKESYFTPSPTPPNFEYYPYSDAGFYDQTAQSILIGEGRSNEVVLRPLYIFFLALLHVLGGQKYEAVILFQTLFLAAMPVFAFLVAAKLGGRPAGLITAILVIVREKNAIALTDVIEVTHSKLLLSDVPTMALLILAVYAFINWLEKPGNRNYLGVIAGGCFGLVVLVRSQAQLLLPGLLVGLIFSGGFQLRRAVQRAAVFLLGFVLVVSPWVWRNYQVSGRAAVENTEFYVRLFAGSYSEPTDVVEMLPGESFDEYNARIKSQIFRYILNHPVEVVRIYASYFLHNEISSVVYLPLSARLYDLRLYVARMPFWEDPRMSFGIGSGSMLMITLAIMAMGVGAAIRRTKFLGLMPLFIHLGYSLSIVPARISGWRYILPVDWIPQLYYSLGLIQLTIIVASLLRNQLPAAKPDENHAPNSTQDPKRFWLALAACFVLGSFLPVWERSIPPRYPAMSGAELVQAYATDGLILNDGTRLSASALEAFLETEAGASVLHGRALYPAYYARGKFWGDDSPNLIEAGQYDRLQFNLIGPQEAFVYIPLDAAPDYFPHASDVFVLGCMRARGLQALLIKVNDAWLVASPFVGLTCAAIE